MNSAPFDTEKSHREPNPSLQGVYENPDGTFETGGGDTDTQSAGTQIGSGDTMQHQNRDQSGQEIPDTPVSGMNSGVDPFRRGDALEPAAQHPDTPVPDAPQATDSDQLAVNPIQPRVEPKD